jgi:NAD(P)-dependent dehydrogenase (short-subunit alcohol dehydrogenase family)
LEEAYHELGGGPHLGMVSGDVSHKHIGEKLLATAVEKFGSADVLVNTTPRVALSTAPSSMSTEEPGQVAISINIYKK